MLELHEMTVCGTNKTSEYPSETGTGERTGVCGACAALPEFGNHGGPLLAHARCFCHGQVNQLDPNNNRTKVLKRMHPFAPYIGSIVSQTCVDLE